MSGLGSSNATSLPSKSRSIFFLLLAASVVTQLAWAAEDPFVGDWKLNLSKSQFIDVMKVTSAGGNKYELDFGAGPEKIVADGSDQSGVYGTMLSITAEAPDSWKVVRKKDGRTLLTGIWKLSPDGKTLTDNYTEFGENGSSSTVNYLYKRTAAGSGFAGTWESAMTFDTAFVLQIRPFEGDGLSFIRSQEDSVNVKFDGKEYPDPDRGAAKGSTFSASRVNERTLEILSKTDGKTRRTSQIELSADHKTLTRTVHVVGQSDPNVFVFERQ